MEVIEEDNIYSGFSLEVVAEMVEIIMYKENL